MRALAAALLLLFAPATAGAVELEGAWHVLVHYTDAASSHPEQPRWHDRVWVFARKNGTLVWTEYPIALFQDKRGRFERLASGRQARVLGAWEPTPDQIEEIRGGLEVNPRGARVTRLQGSDADGWSSSQRARPDSSSVITFEETWSVADLAGQPVFEQRDVMASARTETLEGVTRYAAGAVEADLLMGSYARDGTRAGTFRMTRSGDVRHLGNTRRPRRKSGD